MGASLAEGLDREPDDDGHWVAYSHYWHGYLVVLKPLLCLCSLNQIRVLVVLVGAGLALAVTCRLARQVSFASGVAFGFSLVCVRLSVVLLSLPFAPSFLIALAGCLVILRADGHVRLDVTRIGLPALAALFLVVGALTAFFDFLDTPLVTLGLPLVLLVILMRASIDRATVMRAMRVVALCAVSWALGYGLLFVWKWLLAGLVLGPDAVSNALASFTHRVAAQADGEVAVAFTPLDAVHRNVTMLVSVIFLRWGRASTAEAIVPAALVCALVLASCVVRWRKGGAAVASAWFLVPLVLVSVMPYLWYVIVSGHSWVHAWFTYRTQVVTVCGVLMALAVMLGRHPAETGGPAPLAADTPIPR